MLKQNSCDDGKEKRLSSVPIPSILIYLRLPFLRYKYIAAKKMNVQAANYPSN
jgi:hypothetical protein